MTLSDSKKPCITTLNKAWKSTCRILFGEEVGDLSDFEEWLCEYITKPKVAKSIMSGDDVHFAVKEYDENSKFLSFDEIDFNKRFEPLNINEIKDMDSLIEAVQERICYTGNVVLGNSGFVERSSNISDSHYVYNSEFIVESKYIAMSEETRGCENLFGVYTASELAHVIKTTEAYRLKRCFECHTVYSSSDCYFCARLVNCRDCFFSFGSRNKAYAIGNLELPKEKYLAIKAKLLAELIETLKGEKRIFSLLEIIENACEFVGKKPQLAKKEQMSQDKKIIEDAFATTSKVVLGKNLVGLDSYAKYLQGHTMKTIKGKSPLSGKDMFTCGYVERFLPKYNLRKRLLPEEEIWAIEELHIEPEDLQKFRLDSDLLSKILRNIAYASWDGKIGTNSNVINSAVVLSSNDIYEVSSGVFVKKCAFDYWPDRSDNIFGSSLMFYSSFCINCYNSKGLARSFEADSCENGSGLYFCHNVENIQDGLFCFNTKSKRNAIGNAEIPREMYIRIKSNLLEQIGSELEEKKSLKWDIYNIGRKNG